VQIEMTEDLGTRNLYLRQQGQHRALTDAERGEMAHYYARWQRDLAAANATARQVAAERHGRAAIHLLMAADLWKSINEGYGEAARLSIQAPTCFEVFVELEEIATSMLTLAQEYEEVVREPAAIDGDAIGTEADDADRRNAHLGRESFFRNLTDEEQDERRIFWDRRRIVRLAAAEAGQRVVRDLHLQATKNAAAVNHWLKWATQDEPDDLTAWVREAAEHAEAIQADLATVARSAFAAVCRHSDRGI